MSRLTYLVSKYTEFRRNRPSDNQEGVSRIVFRPSVSGKGLGLLASLATFSVAFHVIHSVGLYSKECRGYSVDEIRRPRHSYCNQCVP